MKVLKKIYTAPIEVYTNTDTVSHVTVRYLGQHFHGFATCHEEDLDFASKKVGYHIALTRARISALSYALGYQKEIYGIKRQSYKDITTTTTLDVDPTGLFLKNVKRAELKVKILQRALTQEKKHLTEYIRDQEKVIQTIRRLRASAEEGQNK